MKISLEVSSVVFFCNTSAEILILFLEYCCGSSHSTILHKNTFKITHKSLKINQNHTESIKNSKNHIQIHLTSRTITPNHSKSVTITQGPLNPIGYPMTWKPCCWEPLNTIKNTKRPTTHSKTRSKTPNALNPIGYPCRRIRCQASPHFRL